MLWAVEQNLPALTLRGNTAPRVAGTLVISGFNNGRVGAYEIADGDPAWEVAIANPTGRSELERLVDVSAGLSIVGNDVYVVGYHGRAVGIDLETGVVLWQQDLSSYAGLGADINNVYVTSDFDAVVALERNAGTQLWRQEALRLRDVTAPTRYANTLVVGDLRRLSCTGSPPTTARSWRASARRASESRARRSSSGRTSTCKATTAPWPRTPCAKTKKPKPLPPCCRPSR